MDLTNALYADTSWYDKEPYEISTVSQLYGFAELSKTTDALKSNERNFHDGSIPIEVAKRVLGKDAAWIRAGIIAGWLPIGVATRDGIQITDVKDMDSKHGRINYFISPKLFYEYTGYFWKGEKS